MRLKRVQLFAKQFFVSAFTNKAIVALTVLLAALLLYATYTGWQQYQYQTQIRHQYTQQARQDWVSNPDKHPHRMAHYGYYVFKPKHPLSFFDNGMDSYTGVSVYLEAHKQNSVNFSEAGFSTGVLRFGEISVGMVLQLLVPLLIFFLGFNSIASLKENHTLKIILTHGASWQELVAGKAIGVTAVALVLYVPVMLVAIAFGALLQQSFTMQEAVRLALLLCSYVAYFFVCALMAVLVSAISRTSKGALITLIGCWLLLMIVLPRATQSIAAQWHPTPVKVAFDKAIEEEVSRQGDSHNPDDVHYKSLKDSLLKAYHVDSVQQLPFNYGGFVMKEGEKISAEIYSRHQQALMQVYQQQNNVSRYLSFFNPYIAIKNISMALAGTDFATYVDFQNQAEQFRYQMAQKMNELQMQYISNDTSKPTAISHQHWESLPDFVYHAPGHRFVWQQEWVSMAALLCWVVFPIILLGTVTKKFKAL